MFGTKETFATVALPFSGLRTRSLGAAKERGGDGVDVEKHPVSWLDDLVEAARGDVLDDRAEGRDLAPAFVEVKVEDASPQARPLEMGVTLEKPIPRRVWPFDANPPGLVIGQHTESDGEHRLTDPFDGGGGEGGLITTPRAAVAHGVVFPLGSRARRSRMSVPILIVMSSISTAMLDLGW